MIRQKKGSRRLKKDGKLKILSEETIWDGFVRFTRVEAELPARVGPPIVVIREVHDHGDVAVVLPVDFERRKLILVRQWRVPAWLNGYKQRMWEAVAGIIDKGESPEDCALREAIEESGYRLTGLKKAGEAYSSPGLITEKFYLFIGQYSLETKVHDGGGLDEEGEDIEVVELSFDEVRALVEKNEIVDAKTLMAIAALFASQGD